MIYPAGTSLPSPILFALLPRTTAPSSVHIPPLSSLPHGIILHGTLVTFLPLSLGFASRREFSRESRFLIYDRPLRSSTGEVPRTSGGEKEETERRGSGVPPVVYFDGRLVTHLNLRCIEYIAPTIYLARAVIGTPRRELSRGGWEEERGTNF